MTANYDLIAKNYDSLSRLIFKNAIVKAQKVLLTFIDPPCNILLAGGGTGWILEEMAKSYPKGIRLTYVDSSAKMIEIAGRRDFGENEIVFKKGDIEEYNSSEMFDIVMTPFLYDNFTPEKAERVFDRLDKLLIPGGILLYSDFKIDTGANAFWQKILLKVMYLFFRMVSKVETDRLPGLESIASRKSYQVISRSNHFGNFIQSIAYRKS